MKKIIGLFIALIAAGLFNSCVQSLEEDSPIQGYSSFKATIVSPEASRAHFESSHKVKWDSRDSIGVFSNNQKSAHVYVRNNNDVFTGPGINGDSFYAFYPANAEQDGSNAELIHFKQCYAVFNSSDINFPMVAKSSTNELPFKQCCGVLHFVVKGLPDSFNLLVLQGNNGELLSGNGTVDLSSETAPFVLDGDASDSFYASIPKSAFQSELLDVYFPIPPTVFEKGFTLTFIASDDSFTTITSSSTVSTEKSLSVQQGEMVRYTIGDEPDDDDNDRIIKDIAITLPDPFRIGPNADFLHISQLGITGTMNGIPLEVKLFSFCPWIAIIGDILYYQGNDCTKIRDTWIQARFYLNGHCVSKKSFRLEQDAVHMEVEFSSNKNEYYYFHNFNEAGKNYFYFWPYLKMNTVTVSSNYISNIEITSECVKHPGPHSYEWADDIAPILDITQPEESVLKVNIFYPSNRNYYVSKVSDDKDDVYYTGQSREGVVKIVPKVRMLDNLATLETHYEEVLTPLAERRNFDIYCIQSGIMLKDYRNWWHQCYPLADADVEGYSRVEGYDDNNKLVTWEYICSNVDWSWEDVHVSDGSKDAWELGYMNADPQTIDKYMVCKLNMYSRENTAVLIKRGYPENSLEFRNDEEIPERKGTVYVDVHLHDGEPSIEWPIMGLTQFGVPCIEYDKEKSRWEGWTHGSFTDWYGNTYSNKTRLLFELKVNRGLLYDFCQYETKLGDLWYNTSFHLLTFYSMEHFSNSNAGPSGTTDMRMIYPNGGVVYAKEPFDFEFNDTLPPMTGEGIGDIKINMPVAAIPATVDGLYDKLTPTDVEIWGEGAYYEETTVLRATLGDELMFDIYFDEGVVYCLEVFSHRLQTVHGLSFESTAADIFDVGARVLTYNDATWSVYSDGIHFIGLQFTAAGWDKVANSYIDGVEYPFTIADLIPTSKPSQIRIWETHPDAYAH